ncbi:MAG: hypothetical protein FWE24_05360 [Defluviitaleaceae bacterium]|nr:hypothetical protein [Defluviitaleaceae bacterium]
MPNIKEIKETILAREIPQDVIAQFNFPQIKGNPPEEVIAFINQMEQLLTKEQCLSVMAEQGCRKTGVTDKEHREFGQIHEGKSIEEKLVLLNENGPYKSVLKRLNDDGTLTMAWGYGEEGNYRCLCKKISRLQKGRQQPVDIPLSFCGCCAGHIRYHNENALGVKLRLREIVSSPLISDGKKHCEFIFEIVG